MRILRLELERGCEDSAVIGGLDGFITRWQVEERGSKALQMLAKNGFVPANYAGLSKEGRQEWIGRVLEVLQPPERKPTPATGSNGPPRRRASSSGPLDPGAPAAELGSVTPKNASLLGKLGVQRVRDLVFLFPRRHNQVRTISRMSMDEEQTIVATVWEARQTQIGRSMRGSEAVIGDETGNMRVVWFNNTFAARQLKAGSRYIFTGRLGEYRGSLRMESPDYEEVRSEANESLAQEGRLFPVYPSTEGLYQPALRRMVREALARGADRIPDPMPEDILRRNGLLPLRDALWRAHYPDGWDEYDNARRRLAFDELFAIQLGVLAHRRSVDLGVKGVLLEPGDGILDAFLDALPFALTAAQRRVLDEVLGDISGRGRPMSRLLQGEVGSGKTVVALAALLVAACNGYQGAIMAPTEVLAEQHFLTVSRLLEGMLWPQAKDYLLTIYLPGYARPVNIGLLTGSTTASRKLELRKMLEEGSLDIAIGTHALIQDDVRIPKLALAVVDEQHRFGVMQRAALRGRGLHPHLLVMSATPIPRTLALTLYGDLDISTLDELPPGRQAIRTRVAKPDRRQAVYDYVREQVREGRQAFIIYPLVDESEAVNARAAVSERERLATDVFPDLRIGLLHGRMGAREKQGVMEAFRSGDLDVLVSTPVVEVGIDVPNATVMVIEGADRFGLAQLHQFRGRVGRGEHPSVCVLIAETPSQDALGRLEAMESISDGFQLAEADLKLRGPGDYFGTRQSGLPDLRMARLTDADLLAQARQEAMALLDDDPALARPGHEGLRALLQRFSASAGGEVG